MGSLRMGRGSNHSLRLYNYVFGWAFGWAFGWFWRVGVALFWVGGGGERGG